MRNTTIDAEAKLSAIQESISSQYGELVFKSSIMKNIDYEITKNAFHDEHVLLIGETGTGKDLIAYQIHSRSKRKDDIFLEVPINSLSETLIESELFGYEKGAFSGAERRMIGKLESANGGTVYIPEISELSERIQLKLLQFLQYKTISRVGQQNKIKLDNKLIMASNADLEKLCENGKIREDFYYRIRAFTIMVPPLRERREDIRPITEHYLRLFSRKFNKEDLTIDENVYKYFEDYEWKGNIRDLKLLLQRAVIHADDNVITFKHFRGFIDCHCSIGNNHSDSFKNAELNFRKEYFTKLLTKTNGNKSKAAEIAGLSRQGLLNILKEIGFQ